MKLKAYGNFSHQLDAIGMYLSPAYLFRGSTHNVLFDAGVSSIGPVYFHALQRILGDPQHLHYLLITHTHWDHCGAMSYLKRFIPQMQIGGFHTIPELFKKESVVRTIQYYNKLVQGDISDAYSNHVRFEGGIVDLLFREGETIDLGDAHCAVYETPGHTRDSVSYYIPEEEILFPGEALGVPEGRDAEVVLVEFLSSYDDYLSSIQKLAALKPKTICLAHKWVFTDDDAARYFEKSYAETIAYRNLIEQYLHETGGDVDRAVQIMTLKEYDEKRLFNQPRFAYVVNLTAQIRCIAAERTSPLMEGRVCGP